MHYLLVFFGYLSGSIPFGVILGRLVAGVDPRTVGSGNIGATNVARAGGKKLGVAVLVLDTLKAVLPVWLARHVMAGQADGDLVVMATAIAAFAGHLFPVWIGFKGGKGVATGLGIFVVLAPWAALSGLVTYAVLYLSTKLSSLGSLGGTLACTIGTFVAYGWASPIPWAGVFIATLIFWRHRENIARLVRGEERKLK